MSRENNLFLDLFAEKLGKLSFDSVAHLGRIYGATQIFHTNDELCEIKYPVESQPLSITKFVDEKGNASYLLVNLSQTMPTVIDIVCGGKLVKNTGRWRFAPGQMKLLENEETFGNVL
jgi:hypothetical protein